MVAKEVGTGEMGEKGEGIKKFKLATSDQDGGIGRYTLPPSTTKRTTINLKTKNNQNFQKNQTVWKSNHHAVKEEIFIQAVRRCRDGQLGWERIPGKVAGGPGGKVAAGRPGGPTFACG